jgi:hypothetical protein
MNNKKVKKSKTKDKTEVKVPVLRSKEERQIEARKVINKLSELNLTVSYDPIKELFMILQNYVNNGGKIEINIPFPMINKRIKGLLPDTVNEQCFIALKHEEFN